MDNKHKTARNQIFQRKSYAKSEVERIGKYKMKKFLQDVKCKYVIQV